MADKRPIIVIKKITVAGPGHHGGSWKVALADFMTALMAFFLVMWLLGQSDETKKAISDYFSAPSLIEYNFENFGAEITLEKLFLDFVNEPMKAIQSFMEPMDKTPNVLDFGSEKLVQAFLKDQLGDLGIEATTSPTGFQLEIPDDLIFEMGTSNTTPEFTTVMEKIRLTTQGLQEANVEIRSEMVMQSEPSKDPIKAKKVLAERAASVKTRLQGSLEHPTVSVSTQGLLVDRKGERTREGMRGKILLRIQQKEIRSDGQKSRRLESLYNSKVQSMDVFAESSTNARRPTAAANTKEELDNPLAEEIKNISPDLSPDLNPFSKSHSPPESSHHDSETGTESE